MCDGLYSSIATGACIVGLTDPTASFVWPGFSFCLGVWRIQVITLASFNRPGSGFRLGIIPGTELSGTPSALSDSLDSVSGSLIYRKSRAS